MQNLLNDFQTPLFLARHYAVLFGLLSTAWVLGRSALRRVELDDELEGAVVGTPLGLGLLATILFFLALFGLLHPVPILVTAAACHLAGRRRWVEAWKALRHWGGQPRPTGRMLLVGALFLLLAPLATVAIYPPTEFDALMFHLPFADTIAAQGRIDFFPDLRFPVFPALQEVLYAASLLFSDDIAPSLVHFSCYLLVAAILFCWGRRLSSWRAGTWAALLWLGVPAALLTAVGAYVDCALTLYVTTALYCLHRYIRNRRVDWLAAAGALLAFGAATKYHGLFFLILISAGVAVHTLWNRRRRHLLVYAAATVTLVLPWYGFIYYHTGSPIFPFFPGVFGLSPWAFELRSSAETAATEIDASIFSLPGKIVDLFQVLGNKIRLMTDRNPTAVLRLPIDILSPDHAFRGESLSRLLTVAAPLVVGMLFRFRRARYLMLLAFSYLLVWAATAKDMRYVLVIVPLFALTGAEGLDRALAWLTRKTWPRLLPLAAVVVTVPLLLQVNQLAADIIWGIGRPPIGEEARDRYLTVRVPPYPAIRELNERFGSDYTIYALFCENLKHFVDGRHLGDWFGPYRYARVIGKLQNSAALHAELTEMGVDFLMIPDLSVWKRKLAQQFPIPPEAELATHFKVFYQDRFTTVYRVRPAAALERRRSKAEERKGNAREETPAAQPEVNESR